MADYLAQEDGTHFLLEDASGALLLQQQPVVRTGDYVVEEVDGTSRVELEDGTGFVLLEAVAQPSPIGGSIVIPRRRLITRLRQEGLEEDEAIALSLLLRTRKRLR